MSFPTSDSLPSGPGPIQGTPAPGRRLVLIGGGRIPDTVHRELFRLGTPPGRASLHVLVCPLASGDPESGPSLRASLEAAAAREGVAVTLCELDFLPDTSLHGNPPPADLSATKWASIEAMKARARAGHGVRELCEADVLFFSGGDQRLILETLRKTPFEETMIARWSARELLIAGTSAGLQVCSERALTGDFHSPGGQVGPDTQADDLPSHRIARGHVVATDGFPLLKGVILDQHFVRRQRQNRLFSACLDHPGFTGLGVDESTALVVEEQGHSGHARPRVVGDSCVFYVDTLRTSLQNHASGALAAATDLRCGMVWDGGLFPFTLSLA